MTMKMTKKILSVVAATAMVLATIPVVPVQAANVITTYDFENGLAGMSDTGYGTAPEVVQDTDKGNVLLFHAGEASEYQSSMQDSSLGENSTKIKVGSPSSLKLDVNPFAGKSMTGATIALWVKAPTAAAENNQGLVGFISKDYTNVVHPDRAAFGKEDVDEDISGTYTYGFGTGAYDGAFLNNSMVYMGGFLRNTLWLFDYDQSFMTNADKWTHMIVTLGNNMADNVVYINGVKLSGADVGAGKRFNHGEVNGGDPGNTDQPLMFEILTAADTTAYLGYNGAMGSVEGVMIDDVTYYDAIVTEAEALSMYEAAKANMNSGGGSANTGGNTSTGADTTTNNASDTTTNNASGNNTTSNKTSSNKTGTNATQNLPQTGVASTGLLIAGGAAAIAAGAILFKKKENDEQ